MADSKSNSKKRLTSMITYSVYPCKDLIIIKLSKSYHRGTSKNNTSKKQRRWMLDSWASNSFIISTRFKLMRTREHKPTVRSLRKGLNLFSPTCSAEMRTLIWLFKPQRLWKHLKTKIRCLMSNTTASVAKWPMDSLLETLTTQLFRKKIFYWNKFTSIKIKY